MTRFCLLGPTYPYRGGIAHYTTLLARHLREEGHEVLLLSFSRQYPGWLFPGKSDKDPSEQPLRTEAEYILDPINPLTWRRALKRIKEWQPDVVIIPWWHPYFAPVWSVLSRGIKRLDPAPRLIFICHNVLPHEQGKFSKFILPAVIKVTLGKGDSFIVHSQADGEILHSLLPQAHYVVTPLPTYAALGDVDTTAVELPVTLPEGRPLLLFAGFVRPYKGLDILLDALPLVLAEMPVHLLVAGEFWQGGEAQYRRQIRELGIEEHVTIINEYLPDELLAACIDRADVVVLPYRSATQSAIIQTAFGRHTPVITTDVGGLGEVVEDGRTGLVVPPGNTMALAIAIISYFSNKSQNIFTTNIEISKHCFSWKQISISIDLPQRVQ
ncbi:MAG TPA: glycosyltransferase [Anaerolineae bacterium]|nr:glycosyltransferase [Anaerolineae bacterium]